MSWTIAIAQASGLGESPFWHPDEQRLYWVDIPGLQIHRAHSFTGTMESWAMPSEPGCIAPARTQGANTGLVIALRDGIYRARHWGGELQLLAPALHDTATTRFNDLRAAQRTAGPAVFARLPGRPPAGAAMHGRQRHHGQRRGLVARRAHAVLD